MNDFSCCYVLADNEELKYYNQMMVSLSSLRYTGFEGKVYILMDRDTEKWVSTRRSELEELSADIVAVDIEGSYSPKEKSRYIKTSMRRYITGDVLYIDTDTILAAPLPEHVSDDELAMVYDGNGLEEEKTYCWHKKLLKQCGYDLPENAVTFNSGIIWMRDTPSVHDAFEKWHIMWKETQARGVHRDQASLNYLIQKGTITIYQLDGRFNVQIGRKYFSPAMFRNACILHMYNNQCRPPVFPLRDPAIKALDYRDERIQKIIRDPLAAFPVCRWIKRGSAMEEYMETDSFRAGWFLFRNHKRVFTMLERVFHTCRKWKKKMRG